MARYRVQQVDSCDANQLYGCLEARIEAMQRRIAELETENEGMRNWIQYQTEIVAIEFDFTADAIASA